MLSTVFPIGRCHARRHGDVCLACTEGQARDGDLQDSAVLGAGRTPDAAQAARMQVRLDTGHVLPVSGMPAVLVLVEASPYGVQRLLL